MTKHIHPVYPLSTQKHIIDLARLLSIASDSEMAQAKLKAGSPKAVPLGVFFFFHMASSPHPHRRLLSLVAFTGQAGKVSQEVLSKVQVALTAGLHLRKRYLSIGRYWKHMTGNSHTSPFQRYCTEASGRALYSFVLQFCSKPFAGPSRRTLHQVFIPGAILIINRSNLGTPVQDMMHTSPH